MGCKIITSLFSHLLFALALLLPAPVVGSPHASKSVKVRGYTLTVADCGGASCVEYASKTRNGKLDLTLDGPCEFALDHKGDLLSYTYKDINKATVIIVVCAIGDPKSPDPLVKKGCGTQTQGILIRDKEVLLSERVVKDGVWCPKGIDEKEFWIFSHKQGPAKNKEKCRDTKK